MKKIFFIVPNLASGGAERVMITIARILKKEGLNVEFLNFGVYEGEMTDWLHPEFNVISLNKKRSILALPSLIKFMKKNRDAIFFSSREHTNLLSLISSKFTGTKAIVRIPNMPRNVLRKGWQGFKMNLIKKINRFVLPAASTIISQNEEMKSQLVEFYGLNEKKIIPINNPLDIDFINRQAQDSSSPFRKDEINFVNICNIAYSKGIDILIEAWPKVKAEIPNAHMYIIGRNNTDYASSLKTKASNLRDFTFLGFQSNPYPFLKHCDVFVLPSRMEGFPNVVLEAMAFNKPVVSTNCVEVIEDIVSPCVNGFVCQVGDVSELATCMIYAVGLKPTQFEYTLFDKDKLIACFI